MTNIKQTNGLIIILAAFAIFFAIFWQGKSKRSKSEFASRSVDVVAFEESLTNDDTVLIKFGATWCPPCREVEKELDKLDAQGLNVKIVKIDVDQRQDLASKYKVTAIPHLMLVRGGQTLDEQLGYMSQRELEDWIRGNR